MCFVFNASVSRPLRSLIVLISYLRKIKHASKSGRKLDENHRTELESGISGFVDWSPHLPGGSTWLHGALGGCGINPIGHVEFLSLSLRGWDDMQAWPRNA
jgi:hypothetical protein